MSAQNQKLDKIDLKILKILQANSKITNLDLSKPPTGIHVSPFSCIWAVQPSEPVKTHPNPCGSLHNKITKIQTLDFHHTKEITRYPNHSNARQKNIHSFIVKYVFSHTSHRTDWYWNKSNLTAFFPTVKSNYIKIGCLAAYFESQLKFDWNP